MLCTECGDSLIDLNKRVYICKECSPNLDQGDAIYWCQKCKESTEHEHKREKYKGLVYNDEENHPIYEPAKKRTGSIAEEK